MDSIFGLTAMLARGMIGQLPGAADPQAYPGAEPGTIFIPGVGWQRMTDWTEQILYDAEQLPVVIAAGQTINFFRNLQIAGVPKTKLQTNMIAPSQMPSGWRGIIYGMHIMTAIGTGHDDAQRIYGNAWADFTTGNQKLEKEGPLWAWPSPYGLTGLVSMGGLAAPREVAEINNGVPSPAAMGKMELTIDIVNELTFQGRVIFENAVTLDATVMLYFVLRAFIQKPIR